MFEQYQTHQYAGFWLRFAAYLIDSILLTVVTCPLAFALGVMGAIAQEGGEEAQLAAAGANLFFNALIILLLWPYFAIMESSSWQGTVGKKLLNIRVTDLDGNRIGFGKATGRYFAKLLSSLICAIGYIMAAFTEKKQGLHDILASTLVLQGPPTPGGVTLNQPPPPPPSDFNQGGGYGGGSGGGYSGGGGSYGQGGYRG